MKKATYYIYVLLALLAIAAIGATLNFRVYTVEGLSMYPAYNNGERVLVDTYTWRVFGLHTGDVVVFDHPQGRQSVDIKRVSDTPAEEGTYYLLGDNISNSADSRDFGSIPKEYIVGRVIMTL